MSLLNQNTRNFAAQPVDPNYPAYRFNRVGQHRLVKSQAEDEKAEEDGYGKEYVAAPEPAAPEVPDTVEGLKQKLFAMNEKFNSAWDKLTMEHDETLGENRELRAENEKLRVMNADLQEKIAQFSAPKPAPSQPEAAPESAPVSNSEAKTSPKPKAKG